MKKPLVWLTVAAAMNCFCLRSQAGVRADRVSQVRCALAAAKEPERSWIILAGCPDAFFLPPHTANECRSETVGEPPASTAIDGNSLLMQLNLEEDGLEATTCEPPSGDPGPGQDLVMALNRINDGIPEATLKSAADMPSGDPADRLVARGARGAVSEDALAMHPQSFPTVAWSRKFYRRAVARLDRMRRGIHEVVWIALRQSLAGVAPAGSISTEVEPSDPEAQAPLDALTTAWIETVRSAPDEDSGQSLVDPLRLAAADDAASASTLQDEELDGLAISRDTAPPLPPAPTNSRLGATYGEQLPPSPPIELPIRDVGTACGELGCGGLPLPLDAPQRNRTIP